MAENKGGRWQIGDTLAANTFNNGIVFGTIVEDTTTYGGRGYKLVTEDGKFFFGDDDSLLVQCSYDSGGDPANQCDNMLRASGPGLYCPKHQKLVDEIEQHLTKLDALEDTGEQRKGFTMTTEEDALTGKLIHAFSGELSRTPEGEPVKVTKTLVDQTVRVLADLQNQQFMEQHYTQQQQEYNRWHQQNYQQKGGGYTRRCGTEPQSAPEPEPLPVVERPTAGPRISHKEIGKMVEIVMTRYDPNGLTTDRVDTLTGILQSFAVSDVDTRVWLRGHGGDRVQIAYEGTKDYEFTVLS